MNGICVCWYEWTYTSICGPVLECSHQEWEGVDSNPSSDLLSISLLYYRDNKRLAMYYDGFKHCRPIKSRKPSSFIGQEFVISILKRYLIWRVIQHIKWIKPQNKQIIPTTLIKHSLYLYDLRLRHLFKTPNPENFFEHVLIFGHFSKCIFIQCIYINGALYMFIILEYLVTETIHIGI